MPVMEDNEIKSLKHILSISSEDHNECLQLQDYQIHIAKKKHLLDGLIEGRSWITPCFMVSKQFQTKDATLLCTPVKDRTYNGYHADESFDGSPLKLQQFNVDSYTATPVFTDDVGEKSLIRCVPVHDARRLLSQYNLCAEELTGNSLNNNTSEEKREKNKKNSLIEQSNTENSPPDTASNLPLWVICDGRDAEHSVLLGSRVRKHDDRTQFILTNVSVQGPLYKDSKVIQQAWTRRPRFCHNGKDLTTQCFAKYFLPGSDYEGDDQKALEIHFHWNQLSSLFQVPPTHAKTVVKATVTVGGPQSAAHFVFAELHILQNLVRSISGGSVEWSSQIEQRPLLDRVKNLVKDSESGMTYIEPKDHKADETLCMKAALTILTAQREEFDFTEELWLLLKDCTSLKDLVDSIQYVLNALQKGNLQPVLHRDNKTTLGELIRDSYYSKMNIPSLDGTLPLEMLVEIGIGKMCKDYTNIFLELVTMDSIERFVHHKGTTEDRFDRLLKLHHTLELIVMLERLELPNIVLRIAARNALKYYETNAVSESHTFSIPIQNVPVQAAINRLQLSLWQAEISTAKDSTDSLAVYMFTETPPFEHVRRSDPGETRTTQNGAKPYYLTSLTEEAVLL